MIEASTSWSTSWFLALSLGSLASRDYETFSRIYSLNERKTPTRGTTNYSFSPLTNAIIFLTGAVAVVIRPCHNPFLAIAGHVQKHLQIFHGECNLTGERSDCDLALASWKHISVLDESSHSCLCCNTSKYVCFEIFVIEGGVGYHNIESEVRKVRVLCGVKALALPCSSVCLPRLPSLYLNPCSSDSSLRGIGACLDATP